MYIMLAIDLQNNCPFNSGLNECGVTIEIQEDLPHPDRSYKQQEITLLFIQKSEMAEFTGERSGFISGI